MRALHVHSEAECCTDSPSTFPRPAQAVAQKAADTQRQTRQQTNAPMTFRDAPIRVKRQPGVTELQALAAAAGPRLSTDQLLGGAGNSMETPLVDTQELAQMALRSNGRQLRPEAVAEATANGTMPPSPAAMAAVASDGASAMSVDEPLALMDGGGLHVEIDTPRAARMALRSHTTTNTTTNPPAPAASAAAVSTAVHAAAHAAVHATDPSAAANSSAAALPAAAATSGMRRPRPTSSIWTRNGCRRGCTVGAQQPEQQGCQHRGPPAVAACDALNDLLCSHCGDTHAPVDVAAALDATRVGAGLTARHSLDCRQLQGDEVLPRPRGGPALRRVVPPERLVAFERINGALSPPDDPAPPPPLQAAPLVGSSKLLVLAKMHGHQWWPGLVAVCHQHAAGPVRVDFLETHDHSQVTQANLRPFTEADAAEELPAKLKLRAAAMEEARRLFASATPRRRAERPDVELCQPVLLKCVECSRTWYLDYVWELCVRVDVATVLNLEGSDVRAHPRPVGTTKPVTGAVSHACVPSHVCAVASACNRLSGTARGPGDRREETRRSARCSTAW